MKPTTKIAARSRAVAPAMLVIAAWILLAPTALAFHHHLTTDDVREAYSIGRDQNRRDAFFANYIRSPQLPDTGPNVQLIEFRTPYEQVAIRARDNQWSNDSLSAAEKDYETHPPEVIVRVLIYETPTFNFPASDAQPDTAGFKFHISQDGRGIDDAKVTVEDAVAVGAGSYGSAGLGGIDIRLHFDASQFKSDDPVTVEALAPTGQSYSTTFDLAQLK